MSGDRRQMTVALVCICTGMSQKTLYHHFDLAQASQSRSIAPDSKSPAPIERMAKPAPTLELAFSEW